MVVEEGRASLSRKGAYGIEPYAPLPGRNTGTRICAVGIVVNKAVESYDTDALSVEETARSSSVKVSTVPRGHSKADSNMMILMHSVSSSVSSIFV